MLWAAATGGEDGDRRTHTGQPGRPEKMRLVAVVVLLVIAANASPNPNKGTVQAVTDMINRVIPSASSLFDLHIDNTMWCQSQDNGCFRLADATKNGVPQVVIHATSASELSAAVGVYLREFCNMTIGWPRVCICIHV